MPGHNGVFARRFPIALTCCYTLGPSRGLSAPAELTLAVRDYLIRASASQAQVAQSVEQRTENTG